MFNLVGDCGQSLEIITITVACLSSDRFFFKCIWQVYNAFC